MKTERGAASFAGLLLLSVLACVRSEWTLVSSTSLRMAFTPAGSPWSCVSVDAITASIAMGETIGECSITVGDPCDGVQEGADGWGSVLTFRAHADGSLPKPTVLTAPRGARDFGVAVHDAGTFGGPRAGQQLLVRSRDALGLYAASGTGDGAFTLVNQLNQSLSQLVNLGDIDGSGTDDVGLVGVDDDGNVTAFIALGNPIGALEPVPIDTSQLSPWAPSRDAHLAWVALGRATGEEYCGSGVGFMLAAVCDAGGRGGAPSAYAFGLCNATTLSRARPAALKPRETWSSPDGGDFCVTRAWKAAFNLVDDLDPWKFDVLIATDTQLWTVEQSEFFINYFRDHIPYGTVASGDGPYGPCDMSTAMNVGSVDGDGYDDVWIFCGAPGTPFGIVVFGGSRNSNLPSHKSLNDLAAVGRVLRVELPPAMARQGYTLAPPHAQQPVGAGGCSFDGDVYADVALLAWHNETGDRVLAVLFGAPRAQLFGSPAPPTPSPTSSRRPWRSPSPTCSGLTACTPAAAATSGGIRGAAVIESSLAALVVAACALVAQVWGRGALCC
jgi:hypothetical protein